MMIRTLTASLALVFFAGTAFAIDYRAQALEQHDESTYPALDAAWSAGLEMESLGTSVESLIGDFLGNGGTQEDADAFQETYDSIMVDPDSDAAKGDWDLNIAYEDYNTGWSNFENGDDVGFGLSDPWYMAAEEKWSDCISDFNRAKAHYESAIAKLKALQKEIEDATEALDGADSEDEESTGEEE